MEERMALSRELTVWVRGAKPSQSFGALPARLQDFVRSMGLSALRALLPADVQERVGCIKRREQNQRALENRKAAKNRDVEAMRHQLHLYQSHCKLLSTYTRAMTEYSAHLATADGDNLFGPGAQAMYLFKDVHAGRCRRSVRARRSGHGAEAPGGLAGGLVPLPVVESLAAGLFEDSDAGLPIIDG